MANPFSKIRLFYQETLIELKKAAWPTYKELKEMTLVVIIAVFLIGVYVSLADFALYNFVDLFTSLVRSDSAG